MDLINEGTAKLYGSVSPPYWDDVWVIGNGPSRSHFDLSCLRGKRILAINAAALICTSLLPVPSQVAVFSADNNWVRCHRSFLENYQGLKYIALSLETWTDCAGIADATYLQCVFDEQLSDDPQFLHVCGNSGYAALNLAYLKRAREIHLVGFDMNVDDVPERYFWAKAFDSTVSQLRSTRVIVHGPSRITAFERSDDGIYA